MKNTFIVSLVLHVMLSYHVIIWCYLNTAVRSSRNNNSCCRRCTCQYNPFLPCAVAGLWVAVAALPLAVGLGDVTLPRTHWLLVLWTSRCRALIGYWPWWRCDEASQLLAVGRGLRHGASSSEWRCHNGRWFQPELRHDNEGVAGFWVEGDYFSPSRVSLTYSGLV